MRLRIALVAVLVLAVAGCAGPEVVDGTDATGGSEELAGDEAPQETSAAPVPDEPVSTEEPNVNPDESDSLQEETPPESEDTDGTSPTLVTSTTVQKSIPSPSTTAPTPEETGPPAANESGPVAGAKQDLANRLGIAADSIEVVSVQEVEWPDASIGCPLPDMVYAQVITNGSRIILSHDGVSYSYHSAAMGDPFYCENPTDPVPGSET